MMTPVEELARKKLLAKGFWIMPFIHCRTEKHLVRRLLISNEERM